jgi:hypothetical protein
MQSFKSVRAIIALMLSLLFCILSVMKYFTPTEVLLIISGVIGWYFSNKSTLDKPSV